MYSLHGHGLMISDDIRMDAYVRALGRHVTPGSTVLDIGTGSGVLALLACKLGARRVYAVEPDAVIQVGRDLAVTNGCASSIEFIQDVSTNIELPEKVDVIVSDIRGVLPLHGKNLLAIIDARHRFLAPSGTMIPKRDDMWVGVVEAPDLHSASVGPWIQDLYGLDLLQVRELVVNNWRRAVLSFQQLLTVPAWAGAFDYELIESPDYRADVHASVTRSGTGHGLAAWFDATLSDGVSFSNAPGTPETVYGNAYFPWPEPVELVAGDTVKLQLVAKLDGDSYVWGWRTVILDQASAIKANFRQSTFLGKSLPIDQLRKTSSAFKPSLTDDGAVDREILNLMDGCASLGEIARVVFERYPGRFSHLADALRKVSELSARYGR